MANEQLAAYLNDHLSGAVTALELFDFLKGAQTEEPHRAVLAQLQVEVAADRAELEALMRRLDIAQSTLRKAAAWFGEKLSEINLRGEQADLHRLQALDILSMGIEGKALMWRALAVAAQTNPLLQGPSYGRLVERAETQRGQLEDIRQNVARVALSSK